MADLSVFNKIKTWDDLRRADEEHQIKRLALQAEINANKAKSLDLDNLGEQVLLKAAMGGQLSPQEEAIGRAYDAKRSQFYTDPAGNMMSKPPAFGSIYGSQTPQDSGNAGNTRMTGQSLPSSGNSEYDANFQAQYTALNGNPKAQQELLSQFTKDIVSPTEAQLKNAGFSDRMLASNEIIGKTEKAGLSQKDQFLSKIPVVGNYLVSDDFQSLNQSERDFINSILRRESGAVISPSEFDNARMQYFPVPGDTPETLAQKAANRENAIKGIQRSAGPGYSPPVPQGQGAQNIYQEPPLQDQSFNGPMGFPDVAGGEQYAPLTEEQFNGQAPLSPAPSMPARPAPKKGEAINGYMYMGGDPNNKNSYVKVK